MALCLAFNKEALSAFTKLVLPKKQVTIANTSNSPVNIKFLYEPLMADFEKRLNGIAQMKAMSETEVGKEKEV